MTRKKPLTYQTEDSTGRVPNLSLIGMQLRHQGNQKLYVITGFAFMGATDEWGYQHHEWADNGAPAVLIVRPLSHLFGRRSNDEPRYKIEAQPYQLALMANMGKTNENDPA